MIDEAKQLKLAPKDSFKATQLGRQGKKEEKANKWMVAIILLATVIVSLVFYFSGGVKKTLKPNSEPESKKGGIFGPKIYEF